MSYIFLRQPSTSSQKTPVIIFSKPIIGQAAVGDSESKHPYVFEAPKFFKKLKGHDRERSNTDNKHLVGTGIITASPNEDCCISSSIQQQTQTNFCRGTAIENYKCYATPRKLIKIPETCKSELNSKIGNLQIKLSNPNKLEMSLLTTKCDLNEELQTARQSNVELEKARYCSQSQKKRAVPTKGLGFEEYSARILELLSKKKLHSIRMRPTSVSNQHLEF